MRRVNRSLAKLKGKNIMQALTHEVITDYVNGTNNDLIRHLDQVKEEFQDFEAGFIDFKTVFESSLEYRECDYSDFSENFDSVLFCESWEGYDVRVIRDTWEELKEICNAIGIAGNGKNDVFNRLSGVISGNEEQDNEQFQEFRELINSIVWVRRWVGAVMVRVGLI